MLDDKLNRLRDLRDGLERSRVELEGLLTVRGRQGDAAILLEKTNRKLEKLDTEISETAEELERCGGPTSDTRAANGNGARAWAARAADAIWKANHFDGEVRAVTSSSIDLPTLVLPQVVAMDRPKRIIDVLVDRQEVPSNAFEFWQQTVRTNNAAFVADLGTKPSSIFTVSPVEDRLRVLAHLSEPIPNRLLQDYAELQSWLISELYEGLLDALEAQVLSGNGTGENFEGILSATGTTAVAYDSDVLTTLRSALTTFETIGVQPTGWVLNPSDAAAIDLLRESATPSLFVTGGYLHGPAGSANIFGDVPRLVSPRVPAGTALLADWSKVRLFTRGGILTQLNPFAGFSTNTTLFRSEMRIGMGLLRPSDFAVITLTSS
jgi:HK97 family phage major capsid protein